MEEIGIKDLYDIYFRTSSDMIIMGKPYKKGETFMHFKEAQVAVVTAKQKITDAKGGHLNATRVRWDETSEITFNFVKGLVSYAQMGLLANSKQDEGDFFEMPFKETIFIDDSDTKFKLSQKMANNAVSVYSNGKKLDDSAVVTVKNNMIYLSQEAYRANKFKDIEVVYNALSVVDAEIQIGNRDLKGFFEVYAKTKVVDASTGEERTCIIQIPKAYLNSTINLRLGGGQVAPLASSFNISGVPFGERGNEYSYKMLFLRKEG